MKQINSKNSLNQTLEVLDTNGSFIVNDIYKSYTNQNVLRGVNFTVKQGEIYGLLGINGAGKTTTMEIIEGLRSADKGSVKINGTLGIQLQSMIFPGYMTVKEIMKLVCVWNGMPLQYDLLEQFGLSQYMKKAYVKLSGGCKQRLHLALALARNPDILIVDEPTAGLDVESREVLHKALRDMRNNGKSVLMTTHETHEAEVMCDRIGILHNGIIIKEGTPLEITGEYENKRRVLVKTRLKNEYEEFFTDNVEKFIDELKDDLIKNHDALVDIRVESKALEDVFLRIVRNQE